MDSTPPAPPLVGVLNLDKPPGISSAAAVNRVKRMIPRGTKIGHAGTLDPFATGVLLLLVGKATRSCESLMGAAKGYHAVIKLGSHTATDDLESPELDLYSGPPISREAVYEALQQQVGDIMQKPPAFSALKVNGQRAYALARAGDEVNLPPRPIRIDRIELLDFQWPLARVEIICGRGAYIRAIARDVGRSLGTGGYLTALRRTFVGDFHASNAAQLADLTPDNLPARLQPYLPALS